MEVKLDSNYYYKIIYKNKNKEKKNTICVGQAVGCRLRQLEKDNNEVLKIIPVKRKHYV